ncbi:MAG TPA: CBS domain-containing protein [Thermoplasmata archaeon]|nr:CBS domain-containing protein [Thermoplasmata archaeon]
MSIGWPTARELMTPQPVTIPHDAPLSRALGVMRSKAFHEIPVLKRKRLAGLITFESIARRTNLPLTTKVEHLIVLAPVVTVDTSYPELSEQLLAAGLRAAPVVGRRGELVGIVSRTDLVRAVPGLPSIATRRVRDIMSPPGLLVRETQPVGSLFGHIRLLEEHPLPVIDRRGELVGAVGVADLGRVLWKPIAPGKRDMKGRGSAFQIEVRTIMRSPPLSVAPDATAGEAAALMSRERVSSVFVQEHDRPVGVVSQGDLISLAVGGAEPPGGSKLGDVYVQVHGLRGSSDPAVLTEIDRVVAKGLRHISRHARPLLLSLHITPHATHRAGDATVHARLNTDRGSFFATHTGWNFYAGISDVLDELSEQTRRLRDEGVRRRRRSVPAPPPEEMPGDPELEARIRSATGADLD